MVLPYHISGYWASPEVGVEMNPNPNANANPSPIAVALALALTLALTIAPTPILPLPLRLAYPLLLPLTPPQSRPRPSSTHAAHRASTPPVLTRMSRGGTEPHVRYGTRTTVMGTGSAYQPPPCRTYHAWPTALPKGGGKGHCCTTPYVY